jgi:hypothetical protein
VTERIPAGFPALLAAGRAGAFRAERCAPPFFALAFVVFLVAMEVPPDARAPAGPSERNIAG